MAMKRGAGIILFACLAAFAFYVHFNKMARILSIKGINIEKVSKGKIEKVLSSEDCENLKRYKAHFIEVEGKIDDISFDENKIIIKTGCLQITLLEPVKEIEKGKFLRAKGFLREVNGTLEMTVYDPQNISTSD